MRLLIGLVAMSLAVGGCSTGGSGSTITTSPPSTRASTPSTSGAETTISNPSSTTLTSPTTTSVTPTTVADDSVEILVTVAGGQLTSERRAEVKLGDNVRIVIRSDTADELHLHGYDLTVDVAAGQDAELAFVAEIPGIFEVELEGLRLQVLELVVNQ